MQEFGCINEYSNMAGVGDGFILSPAVVWMMLYSGTPPQRQTEREREREREREIGREKLVWFFSYTDRALTTLFLESSILCVQTSKTFNFVLFFMRFLLIWLLLMASALQFGYVLCMNCEAICKLSPQFVVSMFSAKIPLLLNAITAVFPRA